MGGESPLRNIRLIFVFYKLQFSVALWHNLLESLFEVLVKVYKVLLKSFHLLIIQFQEQHLNTLFCVLQVIELYAKLSVLLEVLFVPFLTVTVFLGDCIQLDIRIVNFLFKLSISQVLWL